ncbi:hypothetical protein ACFQX4_25440, partial [Roseomonas sp. GCM10028921]
PKPETPEGRAGPDDIAQARLIAERAKEVSQPDIYAYVGNGALSTGDITNGVKVGEINVTDGHAQLPASNPISVDLSHGTIDDILDSVASGDYVGIVLRAQEVPGTAWFDVAASDMKLDLWF